MYLFYFSYKCLCHHTGMTACTPVLPEEEENFCINRHNGNYGVRDVFYYINCFNFIATKHSCDEHSFFSPRCGECVHAESQTINDFCVGRRDEVWGNPWDCSSYIVCKNEEVIVQPCPNRDKIYSVFNTNSKRVLCSTLNNIPCRFFAMSNVDESTCVPSAPESHSVNAKKVFCPKENGKFAEIDVYKYVLCINGVGTIHKCPNNHVFVEYLQQCVNQSRISASAFCTQQTRVPYFRNPWDCHKFIACVGNVPRVLSCAPPLEGTELVFDTNTTQCDYNTTILCDEYRK